MYCTSKKTGDSALRRYDGNVAVTYHYATYVLVYPSALEPRPAGGPSGLFRGSTLLGRENLAPPLARV